MLRLAALNLNWRARSFRPWAPMLLLPLLLAVSLSAEVVMGDPEGDVAEPGLPDALSFSIDSKDGFTTFEIGFAGDVAPPGSPSGEELFGFVDIDTDRNRGTGDPPLVDFLTGDASDLGSEMMIALDSYSENDGGVDLLAAGSSAVVARVPASFSGQIVSVRVPDELLSADGGLHASVVVGSHQEPSDTIPDQGFLSSATPAADGSFLRDGRFAVEVAWVDPADNTGLGQVVLESDDSVLFYFFQESNWELMVKVLDGCGINDRFWVFAGGMTDVQFTLTITDTTTQVSRQYFNPAGQAAPAINDVDAFGGCS